MAEPRKPGPRPPERPSERTAASPPEEAKILDEQFQSQALEMCRQVEKQMQFWSKCREVLEASVAAESGLANKRAALEAAEKSAKEQEEADKTAIEQRKAEAELIKGEMVKEHSRTEIEYKKKLDALSNSVNDVTFERDGLAKEVERLRGERMKEMDELQKFRNEALKEKAETQQAADREKKALDAELEQTRQAIRNLKSSVARIPA